MLEDLHQSDKVLAGKKVLIVDDDIRNIFALTSVLEARHDDRLGRDRPGGHQHSSGRRRTSTSC